VLSVCEVSVWVCCLSVNCVGVLSVCEVSVGVCCELCRCAVCL